MDTLYFTLKELQNEKQCLEQRLNELKKKRSLLEQEMEQVTAKCCHTQEKHTRLSDTFARAEQKVDLSLSEALGLQSQVEKRRSRIAELQEGREAEKHQQTVLLLDFEDKISSIADALFHAKDFYKTVELRKAIETTEHSSKQLKHSEQAVCEMAQLRRRLQSLCTDEKRARHLYGMELSLQACLWAMERDATEAQAYLSKVKAELSEVHQALKDM